MGGAIDKGAWTPSQASVGMAPMGGLNSLVCPWWWPSFTEEPSPSDNPRKFGNLVSENAAGCPDTTSIWPAGAWGHSMHTNMSGTPTASSGTTRTSEIFQI